MVLTNVKKRLAMKKLLYFLLLLPLVWIDSSCRDQCTETRTSRRYVPITLTADQVRKGVGVENARVLTKPGKIYTKDGYLFINELKEGIHIIDNHNPSAPAFVAFLRIPGNGDMAIRNNILYADSYMDLVALDITDPKAVREVNRVQNVFTQGTFEGGSWSFNQQNVTLSDMRVDYVTETVKTNCEGTTNQYGSWYGGWSCPNCDVAQFASASPSNTPASTNGVAGSMARFALYNDFLYTVGQADMQLFDIKTPTAPRASSRVNLGTGIETVFPYKDKLFIGSQTGMLIYDNKNPAQPVRMSVFQHARVCDPVVVNDDIAYITLRSGNTCGGFTNQLDVVDIKDLFNPKLLKSYPMINPRGLGVDFPDLFIAEGASGLKSLDVADPMNVKQLQHIAGMDGYDVIPLGKTLLMTGKDGLYQYDYTNPAQLRLLSKLAVTSPF